MSPLGVQLVILGLNGLILVLGWSLRRNATGQDEKLTSIATDVRQLAASVADHSTQLARGNEKFASLEKRVDGIEDRERERGCFARCRYQLNGDGG